MINRVAIPVIKELPIILVFFLLIRTSIVELFTVLGWSGWDEWIVTLSLWFLYAYFMAASISVVKKSWLRWLWYILLYAVFALAFFIGSLFEMRISPTLFTLLFETNGRESGEFLDTYAFCAESISVYKKLVAYIAITFLLEYFFSEV